METTRRRDALDGGDERGAPGGVDRRLARRPVACAGWTRCGLRAGGAPLDRRLAAITATTHAATRSRKDALRVLGAPACGLLRLVGIQRRRDRSPPRSRVPAAVPADWSLSCRPARAGSRCRRAGRRPSPDVHHGADQHAHHVVQEAVGLDVEAQPSCRRAALPTRQRESGSDSAAWAHPSRRTRGSRAHPAGAWPRRGARRHRAAGRAPTRTRRRNGDAAASSVPMS